LDGVGDERGSYRATATVAEGWSDALK